MPPSAGHTCLPVVAAISDPSTDRKLCELKPVGGSEWPSAVGQGSYDNHLVVASAADAAAESVGAAVAHGHACGNLAGATWSRYAEGLAVATAAAIAIEADKADKTDKAAFERHFEVSNDGSGVIGRVEYTRVSEMIAALKSVRPREAICAL